MEEWKDIKGFEGLYQVSNLGRVKSLKRTFVLVKSNYNQPYTIKERILKFQLNADGYNNVLLCLSCDGSKRKYLGKHKRVNRLVAEAFVPNPLSLPVVNHKDGIKINNVPDNLEWNTVRENTIHAYRNKLNIHFKGVETSASKLTDSDIVKIREVYRSGNIKQSEIAKEYNVCQQLISGIVRNKRWVHVAPVKVPELQGVLF